MNTNFIFIPTEDHMTLGRRGQWMCVHCCRFVEFSADGFSHHVRSCKASQRYNEMEAVEENRPSAPITPLLLFQ